MRVLRSLALTFLCCVVVACGASGPQVTIATPSGAKTFAVEVALTEAQQTQGLMYRKELAADRGMLFVFGTDVDHAFWMKNTLIPLDMLFIAADGKIVGIHPNATPLSTTPISVGQLSRYVLEIAGGEAAKQGIHVGDRATMIAIPSS